MVILNSLQSNKFTNYISNKSSIKNYCLSVDLMHKHFNLNILFKYSIPYYPSE